MRGNRVALKSFVMSVGLGLAAWPTLAWSQAVPARLPDAVTCVYEALTPEQRESAQVMMLEGESAGGDPLAGRMNSEELRTLLEEGQNACVDAYPWPAGKTDNSTAYATVTLLMEGLHPIFEANGFAWADVDAYVTANRARLRTSERPTAPMLEALAAHLTAQGWTFDADKREAMEMYFSMHLFREQLRKDFAAGIFRYYDR